MQSGAPSEGSRQSPTADLRGKKLNHGQFAPVGGQLGLVGVALELELEE